MPDTATTWKLVHTERAALVDTLEGLSPEEWAAPSLCAGWSSRTTTTDHPPAPVGAMLGEVVVHGEDIRRPLGLPSKVATESTIACLEMYKGANIPAAAKKRIAGLRLVASDADWSHGVGPEVRGPALSLLGVMAGRAAGVDDLTGDGVAVLSARLQVSERDRSTPAVDFCEAARQSGCTTVSSCRHGKDQA